MVDRFQGNLKTILKNIVGCTIFLGCTILLGKLFNWRDLFMAPEGVLSSEKAYFLVQKDLFQE